MMTLGLTECDDSVLKKSVLLQVCLIKTEHGLRTCLHKFYKCILKVAEKTNFFKTKILPNLWYGLNWKSALQNHVLRGDKEITVEQKQ